MKSMIVPACLALVGLIAPRVAAAQDVAITNVRVIVGSGQVRSSKVRSGRKPFVLASMPEGERQRGRVNSSSPFLYLSRP